MKIRKKILLMWEKNFLVCELILSIVITIIIFLICNKTRFDSVITGSLNGIRLQLYGTIAAVTGGLLGFIITGLSILLATNDNNAMRVLKSSKWYDQVFKTFMSSTRYLAVTTVIAILALILDRDASPSWIMFWVLSWAIIISSLRLARSLWVLENIIVLSISKK